jgi:hypothetical protein
MVLHHGVKVTLKFQDGTRFWVFQFSLHQISQFFLIYRRVHLLRNRDSEEWRWFWAHIYQMVLLFAIVFQKNVFFHVIRWTEQGSIYSHLWRQMSEWYLERVCDCFLPNSWLPLESSSHILCCISSAADVTNYLELNCSLKAASSSLTHEVPNILFGPEVYYNNCNSLLLVPILSQIIQFLPPHPISLRSVLILSYHQNPVCIPVQWYACYMPYPSYPPWLCCFNYI